MKQLAGKARFGCMQERNNHQENEHKCLRTRVSLDRTGMERYNYYAIIGEKERGNERCKSVKSFRA